MDTQKASQEISMCPNLEHIARFTNRGNYLLQMNVCLYCAVTYLSIFWPPELERIYFCLHPECKQALSVRKIEPKNILASLHELSFDAGANSKVENLYAIAGSAFDSSGGKP